MASSELLRAALSARAVSAEVVDVDHYRTQFGVAVETDYIVHVRSTGGAGAGQFEGFKVSKPYTAFRKLASQLRRASDVATKSGASKLSESAKSVTKIAQTVSILVDKEATSYVGKVSYTYVKSLAKERTAIIDSVLDTIVDEYPTTDLDHPAVRALTDVVVTFLLTDYVMEDDAEGKRSSSKRNYSKPPAVGGSASKPNAAKMVKAQGPQDDVSPPPPPPADLGSPSVVPMSRKSRRSMVDREQDEEMLKSVGSGLLLDDDDDVGDNDDDYDGEGGIYSRGAGRDGNLGGLFDGPLGFFVVAAGAVYLLFVASRSSVTVDSDVALMIGFACYCLGVHSPRPAGDAALGAGGGGAPPPERREVRRAKVTFQAAPPPPRGMQKQASVLLRKSMRSVKPLIPDSVAETLGSLIEEEERAALVEEEEMPEIVSPMPMFPEGAKIGSVMNCWSEPVYTDFKIRGANYLEDGVKIKSGPFLFPVRGVDLFLTDTCPENVGINTGIMGGKLRDKPTMIVNFRLPWGVLLYYFEIPSKFLPFLSSRYDPAFDHSKLPSMEKFTGAERSAARYLMGDDKHKDETLKIVPVVVKGPWVVKSVVGGKPAIIGTKMPVSYVYQPAEPGKGKAEYLEVDLDIVASSAARGILSVVRGYTNILTLDLGFVIQGNETDELPEQMLVGARLHSIDPLTAPPLPPMKNIFLTDAFGSSSEDDADD